MTIKRMSQEQRELFATAVKMDHDGKEWKRSGHHRIYLFTEVMCGLIGWTLEYKPYTEIITVSNLNGYSLSKNKSKSILSMFSRAYFNMVTGMFEIVFTVSEREEAQLLHDALIKKYSALGIDLIVDMRQVKSY